MKPTIWKNCYSEQNDFNGGEIEMAIDYNAIYNFDNLEGMPQLEEKCANIIIADPPYFECKGEFDFVWKSFDEYLAFMEEQAKLYKRVLADNGTLFVYGHAKRIAYVQVIFDKYFNLENSITIKIFDRQTNKGIENFRCFAPVTERLLMYSNEIEMTNGSFLGDKIKSARLVAGLTMNDIDVRLGYVRTKNSNRGTELCRRWEEGSSLPTQKDFIKAMDLCKVRTTENEYSHLRNECESLRRPFNNVMRLSDVMEFSQEAHITGKYDHETQKPEKLTRALIVTCSRENDLVVVPFVGSGTECAMAVRENRRFVGFETNLKHCETARARIKKEMDKKRQVSIFDKLAVVK